MWLKSKAGGIGVGLYLIIWQDGKWSIWVLTSLAVWLGSAAILILPGWQLLISPLGHGFWYNLVGHLVVLLVWPLKSVSKSTKEMYYWLKNQEIEWEMVSDRNSGYHGIPRIELWRI